MDTVAVSRLDINFESTPDNRQQREAAEEEDFTVEDVIEKLMAFMGDSLKLNDCDDDDTGDDDDGGEEGEKERGSRGASEKGDREMDNSLVASFVRLKVVQEGPTEGVVRDESNPSKKGEADVASECIPRGPYTKGRSTGSKPYDRAPEHHERSTGFASAMHAVSSLDHFPMESTFIQPYIHGHSGGSVTFRHPTNNSYCGPSQVVSVALMSEAPIQVPKKDALYSTIVLTPPDSGTTEWSPYSAGVGLSPYSVAQLTPPSENSDPEMLPSEEFPVPFTNAAASNEAKTHLGVDLNNTEGFSDLFGDPSVFWNEAKNLLGDDPIDPTELLGPFEHCRSGAEGIEDGHALMESLVVMVDEQGKTILGVRPDLEDANGRDKFRGTHLSRYLTFLLREGMASTSEAQEDNLLAHRHFAQVTEEGLEKLDDEGNTMIVEIAYRLNAGFLKALLDRYSRSRLLERFIDMGNHSKVTPLEVAINSRDVAKVRVLVAKGCDVNVSHSSSRGKVPLICYLALLGDSCLPLLVELLRSPRVDLSLDYNGYTPLHQAILSHSPSKGLDATQTIRHLIMRGAIINLQNRLNSKTPLQCAVEKGDATLVSALFSAVREAYPDNHEARIRDMLRPGSLYLGLARGPLGSPMLSSVGLIELLLSHGAELTQKASDLALRRELSDLPGIAEAMKRKGHRS